MDTLGKQLRARAQALDLTDAEVARRAGLGARRYGHYVSGDREPDLQTLSRICTVLATTPNHLLGFLEEATQRFGFAEDAPETERTKLQAQLIAASNVLDVKTLRVAVRQVELLIDQSEQ